MLFDDDNIYCMFIDIFVLLFCITLHDLECGNKAWKIVVDSCTSFCEHTSLLLVDVFQNLKATDIADGVVYALSVPKHVQVKLVVKH